MALVLNNLKYTATHEWVRIEGNRAFIGVTDFAQSAMGNVVFVELPEQGRTVAKGDDFCVVESVKGANDVYAPLSGVVAEVNTAIEDAPEKVNAAAFESWFAAIDLSNPTELDDLLDAAAYERVCLDAKH